MSGGRTVVERLPGGETSVTQNCAPEKTLAQRVGWLKTIVAAGVALVAAGVAAAVYTDQFATSDETKAIVEAHSNGDGHPALRREIRDVQDRLIRIEMGQGAMQRQQDSMDVKLDRLVDQLKVPAWLVPTSRPASIP